MAPSDEQAWDGKGSVSRCGAAVCVIATSPLDGSCIGPSASPFESSPTAVTPNERAAVLARTRDLKMARSVHADVRGNTAQLYEWLEASPVAASIPEGPAVWICGDCHLGNLGPVADADRHVDIQIRDLDQTVIANPAYDLIRFGLSLETAARSSDLPGVTTARMIEAMIDKYSRALTPTVDEDPREPDVVRSVRRQAIGRRWRHLAKDRSEDVKPTIPHNKRFWKLASPEENTSSRRSPKRRSERAAWSWPAWQATDVFGWSMLLTGAKGAVRSGASALRC